MAAVIALSVVLIALVVSIWAAVSVMSQGRNWLRIAYMVLMVAIVAIAYYATFRYVYFANENTRFHGWPVPTVIWQRESLDAPWKDFVGLTLILAFPLNLLFYAVVPSIVAWLLAVLRPRIRSAPAWLCMTMSWFFLFPSI